MSQDLSLENRALEKAFQDHIIEQLVASGWLVGESARYDKERALYPEDLIAYARYHVSKTDDSVLDVVFSEVSHAYFQRSDGSQDLAWVTDFIGREKITYQVGYIGGYSSFIGFDKEKGNAVVVLQNAFNWSNYIGMTLLIDMAKNDRPISDNRFETN